MTGSPTQLQILNEDDYQNYRVPGDLGSFGSLATASGILPLQSMDLQGHISGLLYRLRLVQRFYNPYNQPLEATYIFPLPGRAAVSSFVMQTEQRRVIGRLEERGEARRQYEQAIAQGKQAALAEEERSEVFTMTVGNLPPHQFVEVELVLHGPLTFANGRAMFRFPLVVAPRYIPGVAYGGESVGRGVAHDTNAVPDASRISPPVLLPGYPNPVQLSVNIQVDTGGLTFGLPEVSMPDLLCWNDPAGLRITLRPSSDRLDRDLIVRIPLPSPQMQSSFQVANGYYVLNLIPDDVHQMGPQTPRQVVTLLDRSGSMSGWKMVCARRAVGRLVDSLTDRDTFQVLNFDDRIEYLDPQKTHLRWASDRERYLAMEALGKVSHRGGTEILPAIRAGVRMLEGQPDPYLILITDGQVGNESEVLRWIQQSARGVRIFTVGIDSAVNVGLLERIAQVSGGQFILVNSEEQLDQEMIGLRRLINPPILHQVSVQLNDSESSPAFVDLFQGQSARQLGVVHGHVGEEVEVIGYARDGRAFRKRIPVTHCSGDTIQKMWARERVLELEYGFMAGWRQPAFQPAAIAQFALQHGVLCRFTAFVAVDEQSFVPGTMHRVTQAVSLPDGTEVQRKLKSASPAAPLTQQSQQDLILDMRSAQAHQRQTGLELRKADENDRANLAKLLTSINEIEFGVQKAKEESARRSRQNLLGLMGEAPPVQSEGADPVGGSEGKAGIDDVQAALTQVRQASTAPDWQTALEALIQALLRRGFRLDQLSPLQDLLRRLQSGAIPTTGWLQQTEKWVQSLLHKSGSVPS